MKSVDRQFTTISGVPIEPVYGPGEFPNPAPGEVPYTRGIHRDMYRGKLWTMRQFSGFATHWKPVWRYIRLSLALPPRALAPSPDPPGTGRRNSVATQDCPRHRPESPACWPHPRLWYRRQCRRRQPNSQPDFADRKSGVEVHNKVVDG